MDPRSLSNYQLYEIIQNEKLDEQIRHIANAEFGSRKLSEEEIVEILKKHDLLFKQEKGEPLNLKYKIIAVLIPFFWVIHVLMTSKYLARGEKRKFNEYWLYFCIGLALWTAGFILEARLGNR